MVYREDTRLNLTHVFLPQKAEPFEAYDHVLFSLFSVIKLYDRAPAFCNWSLSLIKKIKI